jgi:trans-aconitate methyltransferase
VGAEKIIDLYERHAGAFDRDRNKSLIERPCLARFLEHVLPGGTILDIGCGTGEPIARYLTERDFSVTGVDSSPSMIQMCRDRFPDHEWIVGDIRTLAIGRRFDGVLAWDSFFHLSPDAQRVMFPRFAAHAAPGAALMFNAGHSEGEAIGSYQGEPLYHASLDPEEYQRLLAANGLEVLDYKEEDPDCGGRWIWLARRV